MKKLALLLAPFTIVSLVGAVRPSQAAPVVQAQPKVEQVKRPEQMAKRVAKLTTKAGAAMPGEMRNLEATLVSGSTPVAGKSVRFTLSGKSNGITVAIIAGSGTTDAQGKATVAWRTADLAQGSYTLNASFAGDDDTSATSDEANFAMFKGTTKFDVSYNYGALDSHGGPKFGTLLVQLRRNSDNEVLKNKTIRFTVNGSSRDYTIPAAGQVTILLPDPATTWTTRLVFEGDGSQQAVQVDKTYSRP